MAWPKVRDVTRRAGATGEVDPDQILKQAQETLSLPETDWEEIYFRLRVSPLGADFPAEVFIRTPIKVIRKALSKVENLEQYQANLHSLTAQRGAALLFTALHTTQGHKPPSMDERKLLPFPDWRPDNAPVLGPTEQTLKVLRKVFAERRIPLAAFTALRTPASEGAPS